jgi:hypothetical protein
MRFPCVRAVAKVLRAENEWIKRNFSEVSKDREDFWVDVRLQVWPDGTWALHSGDSSYDQDHRGYWGASSLNGHPFNSMAVARQLIDDCKEHYSQEKDD